MQQLDRFSSSSGSLPFSGFRTVTGGNQSFAALRIRRHRDEKNSRALYRQASQNKTDAAIPKHTTSRTTKTTLPVASIIPPRS